MLRAVIIDDEKKSRETLDGLIRLFCRNVNVVGEADGVTKGIEVIRNARPDIVFLDIQMPEGSGFNILEALDEIDFEVIFTTAYDQYAIKAIKFSALDYLLKPIYPDDLVNAVKKAEERKEKEKIKKKIETLLNNLNEKEDKRDKIVLSTSEQTMVIPVDDIIRCESENYYTNFYLESGKKIVISKTLKEHEEQLSSYGFYRVHKSHLVNVKYIKSYTRTENGYLVMTDGSKVPVSRRKRDKIMSLLGMG